MPELPEVETIRRGLGAHLLGRSVSAVVVRDARLRWPVAPDLATSLVGQTVCGVERRAKYLLLRFGTGTLILHMGMSGSLILQSGGQPPERHDHLDLEFATDLRLRLRDPRRFGCVLWTEDDPQTHPLLSGLGAEPFDAVFGGDYLYQRARGRKVAVKLLLMDARVVAGIGNIYANEALFVARIHPGRRASRVGRMRYRRLGEAIQRVLSEAIAQGGTTLRDYRDSAGRPGYFEQRLNVYGREGLPCTACGRPVRKVRQGQRSSYYCPACQH